MATIHCERDWTQNHHRNRAGCMCVHIFTMVYLKRDAQLTCTEPGLDTGESELSTCIPIFLFPDCRGNATSCLLFLPPCLPSHEGLGPHLVKQTKFFYRLFFRHYIAAVREVTNIRKSPVIWLYSLSHVSQLTELPPAYQLKREDEYSFRRTV